MFVSEDRAPPGQPPLTRWQQTWRYLAALAISAFVSIDIVQNLWDAYPVWFWGDLALGVLSFALLPYRRRWPAPVAGLLGVLGLVCVTSAGPYTVAMVSLATHRRWRQIVPVAAISAAAGVGYFVLVPTAETPWYVNITFTVVILGVLVATGMYVGARRELVSTLRDRADRAEREQALRVAQAQANERASIAREMHDVLAHRISLVAMHAGALAYRADLDADQTRQAAEVIQSNAHRALVDLREVLGLLRDGDRGDDVSRPQPTLRDVPQLIGDARTAGMRVALDNDVPDLAHAPEAVGRHAYRMIQEGLTNARKHAPDTAVHVRLAGAPGDGLSVEIRNPLRVGAGAPDTVPRSGLGLVGLGERAVLSGGRFEHGPTGSSEYVLRAWLPWPT